MLAQSVTEAIEAWRRLGTLGRMCVLALALAIIAVMLTATPAGPWGMELPAKYQRWSR